jgi:hypothetical protein
VAAGLGLPASAQSERCTHQTLTVDGLRVTVGLCVPPGATTPSVVVRETFTAHNSSFVKTVVLPIVSGARTSRTIDDVDLAPLGSKRSLHMTLAFRGESVELEHALALPGATPLK